MNHHVITLDKKSVMNILPHRGTALLVNRAEIELSGEKILSCSTVFETGKDSFLFNGHFPEMPVMPGVLITEAMAQCADILVLFCHSENCLPFLAAIQGVRFFRPVYPGDALVCRAELTQQQDNLYDCAVSAFVQDKKIAQGHLTLCLK